MEKKRLAWSEEGRKQVFNCKIFSVWESYCKSPEPQPEQSNPQVFTVIDAVDWVIVIPVLNSPKGKQFVMVQQWRHGSQSLSLEFPGGVMEPEETPEEAAERELHEETGYKAERIEKLGEFSPNPAIMTNKVHFFLAENLSNDGTQCLDDDEYIETTTVDISEVSREMGKKPYIHALMGTALALYHQFNVSRKSC
jgi:8-oxo-dGTP pyrophosphatase MutT (NUDIX family)